MQVLDRRVVSPRRGGVDRVVKLLLSPERGKRRKIRRSWFAGEMLVCRESCTFFRQCITECPVGDEAVFPMFFISKSKTLTIHANVGTS